MQSVPRSSASFSCFAPLAALAVLTGLTTFSACKAKPDQLEQDAAQLGNVEVVPFPALVDEQRPVVLVSVSDVSHAAGDGAQVVRHEVSIFGAGADSVAAPPPSEGQVKYRITSMLNSTQRLRVVDDEEARRMKKLRDDGLLPPDSPQDYMLEPQYALHCKILECGEIANSKKGKSFFGVRLGKGERLARVKIAFTLTPLRGAGMVQGWQGEAEGMQTSKSKSTAWEAGWFGSDSSASTSPTMDEAVKRCVYDLTRKLVDRLTPLTAAEGAGNAAQASTATVPASAPLPSGVPSGVPSGAANAEGAVQHSK